MTSTMLETYITDSEEKYAPPLMPVLSISVIGSNTFLSIDKIVEDTDKKMVVEHIAQVSVDTAKLLNTLNVATVNEYPEMWVR